MRIHIVRPGDTLWKLSQRYNVPLQKLLNANPQIKDPNQLKVGEKVRIPTGGIPVKPPSKPEKPMPPGRPDRGEYPSSERGWESDGHRERWPTMPSTPGTPYGGMYGCWPYSPWMGPPGIPHYAPGACFPEQYSWMGCQQPMTTYPMHGPSYSAPGMGMYDPRYDQPPYGASPYVQDGVDSGDGSSSSV